MWAKGHLGGNEDRVRTQAGHIAFTRAEITVRDRAVRARIDRSQGNDMAQRAVLKSHQPDDIRVSVTRPGAVVIVTTRGTRLAILAGETGVSG